MSWKQLDPEDPVDYLPAIREECKHHCTQLIANYEACVGRVRAKGSGNCEGQMFRVWECIDHCVSV